MTRVYSSSQKKFIDIPDSTQNTILSAQAGSIPTQTNGDNTDKLAQLNQVFAALIAQKPKQVTALNAIYEKLKPKEETAAEASARKSKEDADRIIGQMEDFYFKNKLHYGNNLKGITANTIEPIINPNSPAARYKAFIESSGAFLAKAAGDSGNVALQEQLLARKPFPTTRFKKSTAEENFKELRKKFGLSERNYNSLTESASGSLDSIGAKYGL
jgi:hypothetical protein